MSADHRPGVRCGRRRPGEQGRGGAGRADARSQSNGSLMRIAPIGVWAAIPDQAAAAADTDSALSHPHPVCRAACAAYAAAIRHASRAATARR